MLAGVSVDYYVRLEQGREQSPSPQVAQAIGRALRLDEHGLAHLYRLAGLTPLRTASTASAVDPQLAALIDEWPEHPAIVLGHAFDVIATNSLGEALFLGFPSTRNLLESTFLEPATRALYTDWEIVATSSVAGFRLLEAAQPDDPRIRQVRDGLLASDTEFAAMWTDHEVRGRRMTTKRFRHPVAGDLELHIQTFDVRSAPGQELVIYRAEPGSPSASALGKLRD
ncbi:helix-turn-helix transcriptional regulator [Pseudonocardia xinjiangensis]